MFLFLLGCIAATNTQPGATGADTTAAPVLAGPVGDWLANTTWACDLIAVEGPTRYDVAHTWSFTDTTWTSDFAQKLADAANSGAIPEDVAVFASQGYVIKDANSGSYWAEYDPFAGYWFGATDTTVLLDVNNDNGSNSGFGAWKFTRFTASDGLTHAEFNNQATMSLAAFDCVPA